MFFLFGHAVRALLVIIRSFSSSITISWDCDAYVTSRNWVIIMSGLILKLMSLCLSHVHQTPTTETEWSRHPIACTLRRFSHNLISRPLHPLLMQRPVRFSSVSHSSFYLIKHSVVRMFVQIMKHNCALFTSSACSVFEHATRFSYIFSASAY